VVAIRIPRVQSRPVEPLLHRSRLPGRAPPTEREVQSRLVKRLDDNSNDHTETLESWAALLWTTDPREYRSSAPRHAALVLSRAARLAVLEIRANHHNALFHPGDLVHMEEGLRVGRQAAERLCNGRDTTAEEFVLDDRDEWDDEPAEDKKPSWGIMAWHS